MAMYASDPATVPTKLPVIAVRSPALSSPSLHPPTASATSAVASANRAAPLMSPLHRVGLPGSGVVVRAETG